MPPASTLDWIAGCFGRDAYVTGVRRLPNAWAAAVHAVDVIDRSAAEHALVLRRWARTDLAPDAGVVEHEAAVLTLLASVAELDAPRLIATDPTAAVADVPALVMTRLAGRDDLAPPDMDRYLDGLVSALRAIHGVAVPAGALGEYVPWGLDHFANAPPWTQRRDVWLRAFEIARQPVPHYAPMLCHRDFHPGNVLWSRGRVSGVVDWTSTCVGPAAADLAHCRVNLALLFDIEIADEFARRYGPVSDLAWFDVVDIVGWGSLEAWRWHDAGRHDITEQSLADAIDGFLAAAVERCS